MPLSKQKKNVKASSPSCCQPVQGSKPGKGTPVTGCQCQPCTAEGCTCAPCTCGGK